jgi:hypothetical protein
MRDSGTPTEYLDSLEKAAAPAKPQFEVLQTGLDEVEAHLKQTSPFKAGNTVASLAPKQVGQIEVPEHAFTVDPVIVDVHPMSVPVEFDESANQESGQLSVEDSIELLFSLYEDISDRITSFEKRLALHNTRASHKI